jgi:hypothetical protein
MDKSTMAAKEHIGKRRIAARQQKRRQKLFIKKKLKQRENCSSARECAQTWSDGRSKVTRRICDAHVNNFKA